MFFLRKLLVVLVFFAGVVHAAPDAKPIHTVSRSFPASGTARCANFFYQQVQPHDLFPAAEKPVLFMTPADEAALAAFVTPQSHAAVTAETVVAGIAQLVSHVAQTVKKVNDGQQKATTSVKFEFSTPEKAAVVVLDVTKNGSKITADVTTFGRAEQMPQTILNLLQAVVCDDSFASKHWGKGLFATALGVSFLKRRDIPVVGELFMPFHERAIAKINLLNPDMFEEFGEFACPGVQWAKLKTDRRCAVVILGKNDPVKGLCDASGNLSRGINQLNNSALVGVECFWVVTEDNIDEEKVEAFTRFVEELSPQGWAFPNKVQIPSRCGLNGVTAGMSNFSVPESELIEDIQKKFKTLLVARIDRTLGHGWAKDDSSYSLSYKNGLAKVFLYLRQGSPSAVNPSQKPILSSASFYFVTEEKTIVTTKKVEETSERSGHSFSTVSQNFVVYRDCAHNQIGLMFNGKMKTFSTIEPLVDCVAKKINKMMQQTTVTKIERTPPPAPPVPPSTPISPASSSGPERVLTVAEVAEIQRKAQAVCDAADAAEARGCFSHLSPECRAAAEAAWRAKESSGSAAPVGGAGSGVGDSARRSAAARDIPLPALKPPTFAVVPTLLCKALKERYQQELNNEWGARKACDQDADAKANWQQDINAISVQPDESVLAKTVLGISIQSIANLDDIKPYVKQHAPLVLDAVVCCIELDGLGGDLSGLVGEIFRRMGVAELSCGFMPLVVIKMVVGGKERYVFPKQGLVGSETILDIDDAEYSLEQALVDRAIALHAAFLNVKRVKSLGERYLGEQSS